MLLEEMNWPEVSAIAHDLPVVVPIAAVEQHGRHLPVFTDSMLLGEVVRRAAEPLGGPRGLDAALVAGQLAPSSRLRRHALGGAAHLSRPSGRPDRQPGRATVSAASCS